MSPNAGSAGGVGCGVSANEYSCTTGAQINFGDLTPLLTYVWDVWKSCEPKKWVINWLFGARARAPVGRGDDYEEHTRRAAESHGGHCRQLSLTRQGACQVKPDDSLMSCSVLAGFCVVGWLMFWYRNFIDRVTRMPNFSHYLSRTDV